MLVEVLEFSVTMIKTKNRKRKVIMIIAQPSELLLMDSQKTKSLVHLVDVDAMGKRFIEMLKYEYTIWFVFMREKRDREKKRKCVCVCCICGGNDDKHCMQSDRVRSCTFLVDCIEAANNNQRTNQ